MTAFDGSRSEELTALLKAGIDALTTGDDWRRYLGFQAQLRHYSFYPVKIYDIADTYGKPVPTPNSPLEGDDAKGLLKLTLDFKHSGRRITEAARKILKFIDPQDGAEDDGGPE